MLVSVSGIFTKN